MKNIAILGSTGSIGTQTLEVIRKNKKYFRVVALSKHKNQKLLQKQSKEFHPEFVSENLIKVATYKKADLVVNALVGEIGLAPTLAAIRLGKNIAIADKEALICGGKKLLAEAKKHHVNFIPIDSEHTGIWSILQKYPHKKISRIILTCSGGPFYKTPLEKLRAVTPAQALIHPTWRMGKKVTIDSATMMNKGFELIECCILYGVAPEQVEIVYHPQGIVHSAVIFEDNSIFVSISKPNMKIPISFALFYPKHPPQKFLKPSMKNLTIEKINDKLSSLKLCRAIAGKQVSVLKKLVEADELAVKKFLAGEIKFLEIVKFIKKSIR
ncbi:1-deoxy-D-xylulose-5-phosphate reductoisomerase [Candidatus Peregrinibacteria bacterium]|nr:1-deoxy-D-xylulose-5-phosphate reductoisomerase [Candidatus Peregrinibacteria bacterium]